MGYDAGEYLNNNASSVYSVMQSSKMLFFVNHGSPGRVVCNDSNGSNMTYICADDVIKNHYIISAYRDGSRAVSNLPSISSKQNRLTIYYACYSAVTPDPIPDSTQLTGYLYPGNLLSQTYFRASKCAVGWLDTVPVVPALDWFNKFTEYSETYTIEESIVKTNNFIRSRYGESSYDLLSNYGIRGDKTQILGIAG